MTTEVSELITRLRMVDETKAGLEAANQNLRNVAETAAKAEEGVQALGQGVQAVDRQFTAAGRSSAAVVRSIDGTATASAAATRVLRQHADAVEKLRLQHEREGRTAAETAEALRRLDIVRDNGLAKARAAGARVEAQFMATGAATSASATEMSRFGTVAEQVQRAAEGMGGRLGVAGAALSALGAGGAVAGAALAGLGVGLAAVARAGDEAVATLGRLQAATGSAAAARQVYDQLYESSQRTGIAVTEAAGTFARFQIAAGEIGATRDQVLKLVDGLQKVAIVSGASGQEGAAAMQQLGQALASGKLNGDELRSVMENMPSLAQALARELGTNIGQLRKMGEEGQLTADRVFPALLKATERMAGDFDKMPLTMSRSFDILGSAMINFTAKLDEALGLSSAIARAAKTAADVVNNVRRAALPTEREQLTDAATASRTRIDALQGQIAPEDRITSSYRLEADRARIRQRNEELQRQIAAEQSTLRTHNDRLAEIEKEGQADRFGQFVSAQAKAAEAARTRAEAEFKEAETKTQKLLKLEQDYLKNVQIVDAAERTGAASSDRIFEQRRALADDYYKDRQKILKEMEGEEDKASRKTESAAAREVKARDTVLAKLRTELDGRERLTAAQGQGAEAVAALNTEMEIENRLRDAGIPIAGKRTEEEQRYADRIAGTVRAIDKLKQAEKAGADARADAAKESERVTREIESQSRRVADDVATSVYEGLVEKRRGQTVLDWFGNLFKRIAIQAASTQIFLPITASIIGAVPELFGIGSAAAGAAGGSSILSSLGQLTGLSNLLPSGGLGGMLTGASNYLFGTAGTAIEPSIALPGGLMQAGTPGLFGTAGSMSLGGVLGAAGLGFGAGNLLGGMVANSSSQRQNSMIGSALGTGAGLAAAFALDLAVPGLGTLVAVLGGAGGGMLGGLIGPGESVRGYGLRFQSNAYNEAVGGTNDFGTALKPIDYTFYNEEGKAAFQAAEQQVARTNEYLNTRNLRVAGASVIGGNKDGADYSWADAGTIGEGFSRLRFAATDNANLDEQLRQRNFQGVEGLQQYVEGFIGVQDRIKALTAEPIPAFTQQLKAIEDQFDALEKSAREYGVATTGMAEAEERAIAALKAQRTETLRQTDVALSIRRLAAGGQTQEAELARQAESARQELKAFGEQLDALALTAADRAARLVALEEVQAAERADIIRRYGEESANALRAAGSNIRAYLDRLAAGTEGGQSSAGRLAAAQAAFERDRVLATGGDRDALGRITGTADTLLGVGRDLYASSGGYQAILQQVTQGLGGLPVLQSYDAQQTAALEAIRAALEEGPLNTVILPGGNIVQLAGGTFPAASAADLAATAAATASTVGTLVSGFGLMVGTTGNGLAAVNQSLGTVNASVVDLNRSLATVNGSLVAGLGGLAAAQATTAGLTAAVNDNVLATGRAQQQGQAVANALLGAIPMQVLASGAATSAGLVNLNQSLATLHRAIADVNTSLATIHGSLVTGLGVVAGGVAVVATGQDITARAVVASGVALQAGQAVGNAGLAALAQGQAIGNGGLAVVNASLLAVNGGLANGLSAVNQSLGTVHTSVVDLNRSLGTIDGNLVNGLGAVAGALGVVANGNAVLGTGQDIIARAVVAAGAALQAGQAVANTIAVGNATAFTARMDTGNGLLAQIAANTARTGTGTGPAYGGGIGGGNSGGSLDGILTGGTGPAYGGGIGGSAGNDNLGGILTGLTYGATPRTTAPAALTPAPVQTLSLYSAAAVTSAPSGGATLDDLVDRIERLEEVMRQLAVAQMTVERDGMAEVASEVRALRRPLDRVAAR
jgi:tape measure domain-containing protein